jgi:hypothetical protein
LGWLKVRSQKGGLLSGRDVTKETPTACHFPGLPWEPSVPGNPEASLAQREMMVGHSRQEELRNLKVPTIYTQYHKPACWLLICMSASILKTI